MLNTVAERKTFFERLHDYFIPNGSHAVAGDFNLTLDRLRSAYTFLLTFCLILFSRC